MRLKNRSYNLVNYKINLIMSFRTLDLKNVSWRSYKPEISKLGGASKSPGDLLKIHSFPIPTLHILNRTFTNAYFFRNSPTDFMQTD